MSGRAALRTGVVLDKIRAALAAGPAAGRGADVLDLGGGTGGLAVQLAAQGHRVTVVDPSPDSLAALGRRAAETGTADRITALQGDATGIADLVPAGSMDLVLFHEVLEVVDDPHAAVRAGIAVLRPRGLVSLLVHNRTAAVAARIAAGRLVEARRMIGDPSGHGGDGDPLARRFTIAELDALIALTGLVSRRTHGVRVFTDTVPAALLDDAAAVEDLLAIEHAAAGDPAYLAVAARLHALCEPAP
jgi:SAM-dependent methyltransferase